MSLRSLARTVAILGLALTGCSNPVTQLVVVVGSDRADLASVHARVEAADGSDTPTTRDFVLGGGATTLPFSFGVLPRGGDVSKTIALRIEGRDAGGGVLVAHSARVTLVAGSSRVYRVWLSSCSGSDCDPPAVDVDGATLDVLVPGEELVFDAAVPPVDGGPTDAGDAGPPDGGGETAPSCQALFAGGTRADGIYTIAPDAGAAFPVYCHFDEGESAGWTLLVTSRPTSVDLSYASSRWIDGAPLDAMEPNLSDRDRMLPSYARLPITMLRMETRTTVADVGSAVTATFAVAETTALAIVRDGVTVGAPADWFPLIGGTGSAATDCGAAGGSVAGEEGRVRVRLGAYVGNCTRAEAWVGVGGVVESASGGCMIIPNTAGGAQVCGGMRGPRERFVLVWGR